LSIQNTPIYKTILTRLVGNGKQTRDHTRALISRRIAREASQ